MQSLDHEQILDAGGIVIEHVEYDWPEKDTDASEGFVDNQGGSAYFVFSHTWGR